MEKLNIKPLVIGLIVITLIPLVQAEQIKLNVSVNPSTIYAGQTARVTIKVTGNSKVQKQLVPLDAILVMDCSGSMKRYSNIINGPRNVKLTLNWKRVGEFTLNKTSIVEIDLQTLKDVYNPYDLFEIYIKNRNTGKLYGVFLGVSSVYTHLSPGTYEVYARLYWWTYDPFYTQPNRIFVVELPPKRIDAAKQAAKAFVNILKNNDRVGLVEFGGYSAKLVEELTYNKKDINSAINTLYPYGGTPTGKGLKKAINELMHKGRKNSAKVIVLFTDGWSNGDCNPIREAYKAKKKGIVIYTIGFGCVNETELRQIAKITGGKYYYAATSKELMKIYEKLAEKLSKINAKNVNIKVSLNTNVSYLNLSIYPDTIENNTLIWNIGTISRNETWNVSFDVKPLISRLEKFIEYNIGNVTVNYNWNGKTKQIIRRIYLRITPTPTPTPTLNTVVYIKGEGPYIGDTLWINIVNESYVGPLPSGINIEINEIINNAVGYNITVNGIEIYKDAKLPKTYISIPFVFTHAGKYTITVYAWNKAGATVSSSKNINVYVAPITSS